MSAPEATPATQKDIDVMEGARGAFAHVLHLVDGVEASSPYGSNTLLAGWYGATDIIRRRLEDEIDFVGGNIAKAQIALKGNVVPFVPKAPALVEAPTDEPPAL